jgi:hypothetical protein
MSLIERSWASAFAKASADKANHNFRLKLAQLKTHLASPKNKTAAKALPG